MPPEIAAQIEPEIIQRRISLNFKMGRVGEVLNNAAYNLCGRIPDRLTDQIFDRTDKAWEHIGRFTLFPDHVDPTPEMSDPSHFWREAEAMERQANGQVSRRILFTIPRGLPREKYREYLTYCLAPLIDAGMAAHIDLHDPGARDGGEQPHAHIMTTMRRMNADGTFERKKAREWNALFTAGRGKVMRAQFEQRGNKWLEENGYNIRLRIRSNEELDGPDALPPEPNVSRAEIEHTKRHPDDPAPGIISLDNHRRLRKQARHSQRAVAGLSAEIVRIEAARQRLPERGAHTMARKQKTGWMAGADGYADLPATLKASARRSYDRWKAKQIEEGKRPQDIFGLHDYVDFVQGRRREDKGWRFERPDDAANAIRRAPEPTPEIIDSDAPPAPQPEQDDPDDMPEADGWDRESRFRARLLAGHYKISESSLTPEQVAAISKIRIDRNRGVATIELQTGDVFEDFGDRIVSPRDPSPETAAQLAQAAVLHGWSNVQLTGTPAYRDEVAIALSLLEPPVSHDWKLSRAAQERLDAALAERLATFENTNAIRPIEAPANEIVPEITAPVEEITEPEVPDSPSRAVALDEPEDRSPADTDDYAPDPIDLTAPVEAQAQEIFHDLPAELEQGPPPTVRVPAVVLKTGEAVSVEWLQANRDAFAGRSHAEIASVFPFFVGEQVNPTASEFVNDPSGGEDLDHAVQEADREWARQVGEAVRDWEAETGRRLDSLPDVAPRTVFITDPADPSQDLDAADMRSRPELEKVADKLEKLTNEQLEKRLSGTFAHYNPDDGNPGAREEAIAEWKARRAAKKEVENAQNQNSHGARVPGHDGAVSHAISDPAPDPDGGNAGRDVADVRPQRTAGNGPDDVRDSRLDGLHPAPAEQSGEQVIRQTLAEIRERYDREAARLDVPALPALLEPRQATIDAAIKAAERTAARAAKEAKAARNNASFLSPGTRKAADDAEKRAEALKAEADRLKNGRQDAMKQARKDAEAERRELVAESERQARSPDYQKAERALRDANLIELALDSRDAGTLEALKTGDFSAIRAAAQDWQREQQRQADALEVARLKAGPKAKQAQKTGLSVVPE
ncbi:MobA/MobL family protein [Gluconobacter albidus]|uniref:MobA/MobL family protein n=1 Tax=Gluconobacter albidus TaxID=318683 RepID=UPI00209DC6EB|nr:MobA/MobL family protein [Gluconobacter albidus]MCP1272356.1 MobA/MobL family protein [Gluconobacter albidus]